MAALVLSADVTGRDFLLLDFWWREFYDENHEEDGVFISDDDGENWVRVLSFNDGPSSYKKEIVDIASQAAANGLVLNDRFRIKFQFRDDSAIESDGYAIDSVCLMDGNYPPELPSQPAPADGAEEQHTELTLSWTGGDGGIGGEVSYDVYMGEDCPPADLLCSQATGESCQAGPLKRDTVYHWFVISTDADGASVKGPVWQFRTFEFSRQWTGEQSSDWLTAENWSPEIVPGPDDYVVISPFGTEYANRLGTGRSPGTGPSRRTAFHFRQCFDNRWRTSLMALCFIADLWEKSARPSSFRGSRQGNRSFQL